MFPRAITLVTIGGFDIKIDPSWIIIAILVSWSLAGQYFPSVYPEQSQTTYVVMALAAMLGFFASLVLHELAHSVVARRHDVEIASITLFLLGGVAELKSEPRSGTSELKIALAGPGASLLLSVIFLIASAVSASFLLSQTLTQVLGYLSWINFILALFNMLPAFPLDGGRVLRALLWIRSGDALQATKTASGIGATFAFVLIGLGLLAAVSGYVVTGLWQIVLGVFLYSAAQSSWQQKVQTTLFAHRVAADVMTRDPITVSPDMPIEDLVHDVMLKRRLSYLPVVENDILLGSISGDIVGRIDRDKWASTTVDDLFVGLDADHLLDPGTPLAEVFDRMAHTSRRKFLVTDGRRLVGVLTLADLTRYLDIARQVSLQDKMA